MLIISVFAAIGMLKEEVENLSNLDQYAELLVRLLCAVPGWSEKNVQVCFQNMRKNCVHFFFVPL